jgi:tetratricopeptide (TPR) repeat protein
VFRDREELSVANDLGDRLRAALRGASYLVVICSRSSAKSRWVEEEIRQFKRYHGEDRVLAVIVDGEPYASARPETAADECFPRALRYRLSPDGEVGNVRAEPIAADLRRMGDGKRLALLKLVSRILDLNLDELVQRDAHRHQQQLTIVAATATILSGIFASLAVAALRARDDAIVERAEAISQRTQAEGLVEFMIGDLRKKLAPSGHLEALDAVGERALVYYRAQATHGLDASALGRRARVLHMLGDIQMHRGHLSAAQAQFEQAARTTGELLRREPLAPERIFNHAQSVYWVGYLGYRRGEDDIARQEFESYLRLAEHLNRIDARKEDWQAEVDYASSSLGTVLLDTGQVPQAAAAFRRALDYSARLARGAPEDRDRQVDLAQSYAWLADAEFLSGRLDSALDLRTQEAAIYERLLAATPSDLEASAALAFNSYSRGRMLLAIDRIDPATASLRVAQNKAEWLVRDAPDDVGHKRSLVNIDLVLGQALLDAGERQPARQVAERAGVLVASVVRADPTLGDWGIEQGGAVQVLKGRIDAQAAETPQACAAALASLVADAQRLRTLSDTRPTRLTLARVAAEAAMLAGDHFDLTGDVRSARLWWGAGLEILERSEIPRLPDYDRGRKLLRQLNLRRQDSKVAVRGGTAIVTYRW